MNQNRRNEGCGQDQGAYAGRSLVVGKLFLGESYPRRWILPHVPLLGLRQQGEIEALVGFHDQQTSRRSSQPERGNEFEHLRLPRDVEVVGRGAEEEPGGGIGNR